MKGACLTAAVLALLTSPVLGESDLVRDSNYLKILLADVRRDLPAGWQVEITPDVPQDLLAPDDRDKCCLLIWHKDKVMARQIGHANPPAGEEKKLYEPTVAKFQLTVTTRLSVSDYKKALDENVQRQRKRLEFEQQSLGPANYIGARPIPPRFYEPKAIDERDHLRQYAILWTQTSLEKLPTHYYRTLSFDAGLDENIELEDLKLRAEQKTIRQNLLKIIAPYPVRPLPTEP